MLWLLLFFAMPILEMYLLITVAGYIDALPTIGLVMLTAVIGVSLLKQQGLETLTRGTQKMRQGQLPAQELAEGLLLAVAGALLITPGFVTDVVGFLILFPPTRVLIASMLLSRVHVQGFQDRSNGTPHTEHPVQDSQPTSQTIEGEYLRKE
ncbi:MAG: hypothetical protein CMQ10_05025 [Gammaproteobacteria bacterium]|nr:hypothetical protein [Gammaproteobacteria bacterium]